MKRSVSAYRVQVPLLATMLMLNGCAGMSQGEQRMVSGAAIGAVVGGPVGGGIGALFGAGVGAGVGYAVNRNKESTAYAGEPSY